MVDAADGYQVVCALPARDAAWTDRVVRVADRGDDPPWSTTAGPLRLRLPADTRHAWWMREVVALTTRRAP